MKAIKSAIDKAKRIEGGNYFNGDGTVERYENIDYRFSKSELLHLLSLVAENAFYAGMAEEAILDRRTNRKLSNEIFEEYWKQFTDNIKK